MSTSFLSKTDYENSIIELFRKYLGYNYKHSPDVERNFSSPLYDLVLEDCFTPIKKPKVRQYRMLFLN